MTEAAPHDTRLMMRALELAELGLWTTDPNPRVGCVIAAGDRIVAEGWHERAGLPHAEVMALAAAGAAARGSTAYVTLEPCCHRGRTPPCTDALIAAGVRRVCYALRDPNPRVSGGGAQRLAAAGIEVFEGPLADEARALNRGFLSRMERGRPWIRLSRPDDPDRERLRARSSAVLTTSAVVKAQDPRLDVQIPGATRQPLRVLLDPRLSAPASSRVFAPPGEVLVLTASEDTLQIRALLATGARVERIAPATDGLDLAAVARRLAELGVNELQVECGSRLAKALGDAGLIDEAAG